jgi:hypothetical protein
MVHWAQSIGPYTARLFERILADKPHPDDGRGREFYRLTCERDLEGIVAKRMHGGYGEGWFKIRNPLYSQYEGRRELFEKRRAAGA